MRSSFGAVLLIHALVLASSTVSTAQEWTRFRGPNGSGVGVAANLPAKWTDKDYLWTVKLPGVGHSSPVLWGDRIFVTSGLEEDATQVVQCLKTADGQVVWKKTFESATHPKNKLNCYATSTPAVDEQHLYVTWANTKAYIVVALDQKDGREVWRCDLGPFKAEHGFGASPILFEDLLIVANEQNGDSFIVALDRLTGKQRWKAPRRAERAAYSTPCIYQPDGGKPQLILTSTAHGVSSLDPRSGKALWEVPVFTKRIVGSPTLAAGLIFAAAGEGSGGVEVVAVQPGDPDKGVEAKVAYKVEPPLPYVPMAVAKDSLVFLLTDTGVAACLDGPTGKVLWRQRLGGNYFSSPVRVGDRVYCVSREGEVVVFAAANKYEELGRVKLGEPSHSTPAIAGGVMYLRTFSQVMALGPQKE